MGTKQKIIEALEGKRTERVWELIENAVKEIYGGNMKIPKETKEEYLVCEKEINDEANRYIIIEDYNIGEGFSHRLYEVTTKRVKNLFSTMFEDYFSDCNGGWEQILLVDMKEMKCYLLDKEIKYHQKEVKIK